jgi:hypothetical protein
VKSSCQGARRSSSGRLSEIAASIDVLPCRARSCRSRPRKHWRVAIRSKTRADDFESMRRHQRLHARAPVTPIQ